MKHFHWTYTSFSFVSSILFVFFLLEVTLFLQLSLKILAKNYIFNYPLFLKYCYQMFLWIKSLNTFCFFQALLLVLFTFCKNQKMKNLRFRWSVPSFPSYSYDLFIRLLKHLNLNDKLSSHRNLLLLFFEISFFLLFCCHYYSSHLIICQALFSKIITFLSYVFYCVNFLIIFPLQCVIESCILINISLKTAALSIE